MTVRMILILEENTSAEQDANALYGIKAYGFAQGLPWMRRWTASRQPSDTSICVYFRI
jgi:hypothetical protein